MSRSGTHSNQKATHAFLNTCHSLRKKKVWDFRDFRREILLILKDEVMTRQRECLVKDVSEGGKMRGGLVMWRGGEDRRQEGEETGLTPRLQRW